MVLLLLTFCLLLLPLWESVIVLCFVVRYFMSILVLQSSWWGRESWLLCLICLPGVSWWLSSSSSRCHGVVCSLWLWYFLIILTTIFVLKRELQSLTSFVMRLLSCFASSSPCCGLVYSVWFWQFLVILTYFLNYHFRYSSWKWCSKDNITFSEMSIVICLKSKRIPGYESDTEMNR